MQEAHRSPLRHCSTFSAGKARFWRGRFSGAALSFECDTGPMILLMKKERKRVLPDGREGKCLGGYGSENSSEANQTLKRF
jgi:hypothetical protein